MGYTHVFYFRTLYDANEFASLSLRDFGFFSCSVSKSELLCPYPFKVVFGTVQLLSPLAQCRLINLPQVAMGFTNQMS